MLLPSDLIKRAKLTVEFVAILLNFFEKVINIKYPYHKIDLVGLPNSSFHGTKSWGLITFPIEQLIIVENTTIGKIFNNFMKVSDKIIHQVLSNLFFRIF